MLIIGLSLSELHHLADFLISIFFFVPFKLVAIKMNKIKNFFKMSLFSSFQILVQFFFLLAINFQILNKKINKKSFWVFMNPKFIIVLS